MAQDKISVEYDGTKEFLPSCVIHLKPRHRRNGKVSKVARGVLSPGAFFFQLLDMPMQWRHLLCVPNPILCINLKLVANPYAPKARARNNSVILQYFLGYLLLLITDRVLLLWCSYEKRIQRASRKKPYTWLLSWTRFNWTQQNILASLLALTYIAFPSYSEGLNFLCNARGCSSILRKTSTEVNLLIWYKANSPTLHRNVRTYHRRSPNLSWK